MLARPVTAALACRQCQSAILRAVVTRPISTSFRALPQRQTRPLPILTQRFFSQERVAEPTEKKAPDTLSASEEVIESTSSSQPEDVPWFLEVEPPTHAPSQHAVELPKIPEDAPAVLEPMMKYVFEDMGLDDISLLDLRDIDPPAALGPNLIMLFGTARSERHLHISSGRFVRWLKRNHKINARADGLIGPGELRTKLRRLRKKAKLMGTNTAIIPGGDNGISTGWVCVNFSSDGHKSGEVESFDESGRFSGFGAPLTGTTIVIQCMTEARRHELDLEALWQAVLKKNLQDANKIKDGRLMDKEELAEAVAAKVQLPTSPSELQWQAMKGASQQKRSYSTSARRLSPSVAESPEEEEPEIKVPDLAQVRKLITDIQLLALPFAENMLNHLIRDIFQSPSASENTAAERLSLVDQVLKTAEERGMSIWNEEMYVTFTEATMRSPAYGPELERAQKNLDYLAAQNGWQFNADQIVRLMRAYAWQQDWTRFWDAFRMPSRFKVSRESQHYELAYLVMSETGSQDMCIEALRWVYPEMMSQDPPVYPVGKVYTALKACIAVADPAAESLLRDGIPESPYEDLLYDRRMINREFLKLLREVDAVHSQILAGRPVANWDTLRQPNILAT
ncbi:ATPase synthesis protein 25, mitochondrial [Thelonectria olida]|uniref:ATPase synthesis protein 25 n=1 Tax=Thelonectria olida TaxID=1576542 RepID=A0A9P8WB24_9HYPO|nr:ATPase synthesis protein 25, mitochondrial [Thelonectria olida]